MNKILSKKPSKLTQMKKSLKMIGRNLKFVIPIFMKKSPLTLLFMILNPVAHAAVQMVGIIVPAQIIGVLMGSRDVKELIILVAVLVGSRLVGSIFFNFADLFTDYTARKVDFYIDEMLNQKVMSVDYFNVEDPVFIDKLDRAKKGMNEYSNGIYDFLFSCTDVIRSIIVISGVITIIIASGQYFVIAVAMVGILVNTIVYRKVQNYDQDFRNAMVRNNRKINYYGYNMAGFRLQKELRLYHGKKLVKNTSDIIAPSVFDEYDKIGKKTSRFHTLDSVVYFLCTKLITIIYLGYSAIKQVITVSTLTMLVNSMGTLDSAISQLVYALQDYVKACSYQNDFIDLMEMKSDFTEGKDKIDEINTIEFKNVSFKYPRTENYILKNVSFKISNKEKISLVGLNGSGKTTIIKLICRFYKVEEGEILINGVNINKYDYNDYMNLLAIVFQDFKIISFTIRSNVAIVDRNQEKLYDCLKRAQVLDKVLSFPDKENTYINKWFDKSGVEFSGGEMQKFAIARCLYKDGDFVVLDEPTSALDPVTEAEIYYHFNEIVGKKLTLFISHRLSSCIFSDRIMLLDGCRIVEEGTHKELMAKKDGLYYQMFTAQAKYYQD